MSNNSAASYLHGVAAIGDRVYELVKIPWVMELFRQRARDCAKSCAQQWPAAWTYLERRCKHRMKDVEGNLSWTDWSAGPPRPEWVFDTSVWVFDTNNPHNKDLRNRVVFPAWCPPELSLDGAPTVKWPLSCLETGGYEDYPDSPDRERTLDEKYAACAAAYDNICKGEKKINPWEGDEQFSQAGACYEFLREHTEAYSVNDWRAVERFLEAVEADIADQKAAKAGVVTTTQSVGAIGKAVAMDGLKSGGFPADIEASPIAAQCDELNDCMWSEPMSMAEMGRRLCQQAGVRARKVKSMLKRYGLKKLSAQNFQVRLDTMPPNLRQRIETPFKDLSAK